jgi:hypothetical protein
MSFLGHYKRRFGRLIETDRVLFGIHILLAAQAMLFAPEADPEEEAMSPFASAKTLEEQEERQWEMVRIPDTPGTTGGLKSPMTPRTKAFNVLDGGGDLPLREKFAPQVYTGIQKP